MLEADDELARMLQCEASSKAEGGNLLTDIGALLSDLGSSVGEFFGTPRPSTELPQQEGVDEQLHLALAGRLSPQLQTPGFPGVGAGFSDPPAEVTCESGIRREPELH
eukprot:5402257-Prymnesium_polylepis.1